MIYRSTTNIQPDLAGGLHTDPSGYFLKKLFKNKVFRVAVGIGLAVWGAGVAADWLISNQVGWFTQFSGAFSEGWVLTGAGKAAVGAVGGFAGGLGASGGDIKAAVHGGFSGALFGFAGSVGAANDPSRYFAHAAAGCISSAIGGADCDQGASAALAGKLVSNHTPQSMGGPEGFVAASVAGGTASVVTGGKFGNGAYTAAYGYLYNQCQSVGCFRELQNRVSNFFANLGTNREHTASMSAAISVSGHLGPIGLGYSEGASADSNGQICQVHQGCIRLGLGVYAGAGAQGGVAVKQGIDLAKSGEFTAYVGGGADASLGVKGLGGQVLVGSDKSINLSTGVPGAGIGAGISAGVDVCVQRTRACSP